MEISGEINSGKGQGAFFTQVEWVVRQCEELLGFTPFPGTLNVHISDSDIHRLNQLLLEADFDLVSPDPAFCNARVKRVAVNGVPAAIVLPNEEVRVHKDRVLGEDHDHVRSLKSLVKRELPRSPRDFEKKKDEKAGRYGD